MTILLTTHLMEEADRCDRLAILDRGQLVALSTTPRELKEQIGGDVISVETRQPQPLAEQISKRFGIEAGSWMAACASNAPTAINSLRLG